MEPLLTLPDSVSNIVVPLPHLYAQGEQITPERRLVYFETAREGVVDRQGEDIAADALWASRKHFLEQGNFDINHFSWLGNPAGTGMRPEYVIGLPFDVKRQGKSIWVAGEIFSSTTPAPAPMTMTFNGETVTVPPNAAWADHFWHSIKGLNPPMRWFPSIFGKLDPRGVKLETRSGKVVRFISGPIVWFSVGFAQRAQHPLLGSVSSTPIGPFSESYIAKADMPLIDNHVAYMNLETFAKAVQTVGDAGGGSDLTGVPAIRRESLEGVSSYEAMRSSILKRILSGKLEGTFEAIVAAFKEKGLDAENAAEYAKRLDKELDQTLPS